MRHPSDSKEEAHGPEYTNINQDTLSSDSEDEIQNEGQTKKRNRLSIININAQRLNWKLQQLVIETEEHDIAIITETWLHKEIPNEENMKIFIGTQNFIRKTKRFDKDY